MRLALILIALACATVAAQAFPIVDGNTAMYGRTYVACDTVTAPAGPTGRTRTIYLIAGTAVQSDSVLNVWRDGGAVPAFRRIQGMRFSTNNISAGSIVVMTIHRDGATSSMNRMYVTPYAWMDFPVEADSIVFRSATASTAPLVYCAW